MKKILKLLSIVMILFSLSVNADAQTKHNKKEKKEMMKSLNLSKQQKDQLKASHKATKQEMVAIKKNSSLSEAQKKEKMQQLHKEKKEKLETILTPEQKARMKEFRKNEPRRGVTNMPNERTIKQ